MAQEPTPDPLETSAVAALASRVAALEQQVAALQAATRLPAPPVPAARPSVQPSAPSRKKPSLESSIGSGVLSKLAVLLLLAGAAWFLKWAFDNRWIGAAGRVLIGLAVGIALILGSERFRRSGTPAFSFALKAIGSGVLYLSLWASVQLYHLVPAPVAFGAMLLVTAWNATLALSQDSSLLAAYALLGAYLTPALLSTGGDHGVFLFSYLATIAAAVAALLARRSWNRLLVAPIPATAVFFILWYIAWFHATDWARPFALMLLLWCVFAATPLLALRRDDLWASILQPIAAALFIGAALHSILSDSPRSGWMAWLALAFAAVYLLASRFRRPSLLSAIHLSLAVAFLTVAIPLKLNGHGIALGWMTEALVVIALARNSSLDARDHAALRWLGAVALSLGACGAIFGPAAYRASSSAFWNVAFFTAMAAAAALVAALLLLHRDASRRLPVVRADPATLSALFFLLLNLVLLVAFWRELHRAFGWQAEGDFAFSAWIAAQGALMLACGFWQRSAFSRWTGLGLLAATLLKTVAYDMRSLSAGYHVVSYIALGLLLLGASYAYSRDWLGLGAANEMPNEMPNDAGGDA